MIGDSYTLGSGLDEDAMYYAPLRSVLGMEVFVYGAGGFGTMQEYLALDRPVDRVRPDLVVLQTCNNAFVNNDWGLERGSYFNNNYLERPYWEHGRAVVRHPFRLGRPRALLTRYSRLWRLFEVRLAKALILAARKGWLHSVEETIQNEGLDFPPFARAPSRPPTSWSG